MGKSKPKAAKSQMDPDFKNAWMEQYANAQGIAGDLGARQFAGFTPDWMSGANMARKAAGAGQGAVNMGLGAARQVAGYDPMMVQGQQANRGDIRNVMAGSMPGQDMSSYMNPYLDSVLGNTMNDMDRQRQMMMQGIGDQAARAGAFGGSRHGVSEGETNRGFADAFARTSAGLRAQGFDTASGLMQQDMNRDFQGQQLNQGVDAQLAMLNPQMAQQANLANQTAGLQGQQMNLAGAGMLGQLGQQQQNLGMTGASALQNLGAQQQQLSQQQMDAIRNLPMEQQQIIMQMMQANPGGGGGMINTGGTPGSSGLLGAAMPLAGAVLGGPIGGAIAGQMFGGGGGAPTSLGPAFNTSTPLANSTLPWMQPYGGR